MPNGPDLSTDQSDPRDLMRSILRNAPLLGAMFTSVAFAELPAQQGWLYQWDEQSFASLHDVETEMRARPNGRDHQLAFPDGLTTSSNNLEIVRLDYRVAGTLDIGSTRPPMAQVYELYGGLTPGGTFFSAAGCAGQPTGWCTSETVNAD